MTGPGSHISVSCQGNISNFHLKCLKFFHLIFNHTIYKQTEMLAKKLRSYHCNIIKNDVWPFFCLILLMCFWCTNHFIILHDHLLNNVWLSVRTISGRLDHQLETVLRYIREWTTFSIFKTRLRVSNTWSLTYFFYLMLYDVILYCWWLMNIVIL